MLQSSRRRSEEQEEDTNILVADNSQTRTYSLYCADEDISEDKDGTSEDSLPYSCSLYGDEEDTTEDADASLPDFYDDRLEDDDLAPHLLPTFTHFVPRQEGEKFPRSFILDWEAGEWLEYYTRL